MVYGYTDIDSSLKFVRDYPELYLFLFLQPTNYRSLLYLANAYHVFKSSWNCYLWSWTVCSSRYMSPICFDSVRIILISLLVTSSSQNHLTMHKRIERLLSSSPSNQSSPSELCDPSSRILSFIQIGLFPRLVCHHRSRLRLRLCR